MSNFKYALRMIGRNPRFAVIVIITLALGIGANTAVFTVTDAVLLQTMEVRDPFRLITLSPQQPGGFALISYPVFEEMRQRQSVLEGLFAATGPDLERAALDGERLPGVKTEGVTGDYFQVLGLRPQRGRFFTRRDEESFTRADGDEEGEAVDRPVGSAVIAHSFWQRQFGSADSAVGRLIEVDGLPFEIVGVAPKDFTGTSPGRRTEIWLPLEQYVPARYQRARTLVFFSLMGRLAQGTSLEQAEQALTALYRQLRQEERQAGLQGEAEHEVDFSRSRIEVESAAGGFTSLRRQYQRPLLITSAVSLLLLLIACFNVANLMLARAARRQREMTTRLALGAGRRRLMSQLLGEASLLALAGGALGCLLAWASCPLLMNMISLSNASVEVPISPNLRVLGFSALVSLLTGLLFGLLPALQVSRFDLAGALQAAARSSGGRKRQRLNKALVALQLALSLVMLAGAGLMLRTLIDLTRVDTGFQSSQVMVATLGFDVPPQGRAEAARQLVDRLQTLPQVRSAGASWMTPFDRGIMFTAVEVPDYTSQEGDNEARVQINVVTPGYVETLGIDLAAGRAFTPSDREGTPKVALVNEAFQREFLRGGSALGVRLRMDEDELQIVGVTRDSLWNDLRAETEPMLLLAQPQWQFSVYSAQVRIEGPSGAAVQAIRGAVMELPGNPLLVSIDPLESLVARSISRESLVARMAAVFAALGFFLAGLGLYGVVSYGVVNRRREIGIRMALGAARPRILWMILRETLWLAAVAVVLGIPAVLAASQVLESLLFQLQPNDPPTLVAVTLLLIAVSLAAGLLPARRAAAVQPAEALRSE
ncbi:MAG TPA: ABC transporter permease [Acidobacteriota bacterium]|nr:ABC transporter permease [Acidobacteriota bacterium]